MIIYKSGTSLLVKWGKLSVKPGLDRGLTAQSKPLVAIGGLQYDYVSTKNDQSNGKTFISIPEVCIGLATCKHCYFKTFSKEVNWTRIAELKVPFFVLSILCTFDSISDGFFELELFPADFLGVCVKVYLIDLVCD